MNTRILLLALSVAALSSCSSMYKSGQTPDDVYYSPARQQAPANNDDEYVDVRQPKQGSNYQTYEQYQDNYRDDRFLRMSVGNPYYLNSYNTYSAFDWRANSYYDGFNYGFSSPWNNYFAWNSFYNPYALGFGYGSAYGGYGYGGGGYYGGSGYHTGGVAVNYRTPISRPVTFNVNSYSPNNSRSGSRNLSNTYYNNGQRYNNGNNLNNGNRSYNTGSNNNNGNRSYTPANTNSNNNSYTPSRSYTPSSSGSSGGSSGGGGGGGGAVSRPTRGN